jgi:NAD(P)-dependent dehydrogenase (short-subunit alcohol dehydrogenase family)
MIDEREGLSVERGVTRRQAIAGTSSLADTLLAASISDARGASASTGSPRRTGNVLAGKSAVVTGAARGIGRAIAVVMAANGADVVGLGICAKILPVQEYAVATRADLDETGHFVTAHGRGLMPVVGDIRDIQFLRETADKIGPQWGGFEVVANADIAPAAVFLASDSAAMVTGASYDVTGGDDAHNLG